MKKRIASILRRWQDGFTLLELMAVMAILAVLVAVVAPAVTSSRNASIDAQILQDATQVRAAAAEFYKAQSASDVRTPHTVAPTTKLAGMIAGTTSAIQKISSRWPEKFITTANAASFPASYAHVFQTSDDPIVDQVVLLNEDGEAIGGSTLLTGFTAINLHVLKDRNLIEEEPAGSEMVSSNGAPDFLWLFQKTSSSAAPESSWDSRKVAVFKLVNVEQLENTATASGEQKVKLTYRQIFGSTSALPTPTPTPRPTATPTPTSTPTATPTPTSTPTATPTPMPDTTAPTVTISSTASDPTNTSPIPMTATFSEPVTGFDIFDIFVPTSANVTNVVAVSGTVYTFNVAPTSPGVVIVNIPADAATDAALNGNTAATFSITYDTTPPTVTINAPLTMGSQMVTGTMEEGATVALTSTTGITFGVVTYPTTTTWSASATLAVGSNSITAIATDAAGNTATATIVVVFS